MALTINFTFSAACPGDNHFTVTVNPTPGADFSFLWTKAEAKEALTQDELAITAKCLLRLMVRQLTGTTAAAIKTAIEAKTIDLTVTG